MGTIANALQESIRLRNDLLEHHVPCIEAMAETLVEALHRGRRIYLLGNGGSAADAQHIAAELVGRFKRDRRAVPAQALTTDTSVLTAVGNDFGYDNVFARQVEAFVAKGDVVIGISTSGSSENVIHAMAAARRQGAVCLGLTGRSGGKLKEMVEHCLCVDSRDSARIQECHITVGHILCDLVEEALFDSGGT